ncbi:MAG: SMC-Scp complex subunit ScpB [Patescibacteria group bacterium]
MSTENKLAKLEALLFVHGEPLTLKKVAAVFGVEKAEVQKLAEELKGKLEDDSRGLVLVADGEKLQLATKPQFGKILEDFVKEELSDDLTPASLESLAIVSYFGPISRARIEYVRGVNSSFILRSLLLRGLVERFDNPEHPNTFLYRPTFEAWRHLGLKGKEDLPDVEKYQELLKKFETQTQNNSPAGGYTGQAEASAEGNAEQPQSNPENSQET